MLTYTSTYKAYQLETESPIIQLSECAWIETSDDVVSQPVMHPDIWYLPPFMNKQPELDKFKDVLISSRTRLKTMHTEEEFEKDPFRVHKCAYIAIALSILCNEWLGVGPGSFLNNREL